VKQEADPRHVLACVVAMGTNMGLWKMAEVSGLGHSALMTTARNFLRAETLHTANDAVSNATAELAMFDQYDIDGIKHSSSDGQRIETQVPTINARHDSKYFGLKKGVSAYTLVANHVPCNARIIGTHEHESHFVFDILHNNTTDIQPERHSTDTHGTNQVNFWLLFFDGYQFAPRSHRKLRLHDQLDTCRHRSPGSPLSEPRLLAPLHDRSRGGRATRVKIANFTFSRRWAKMTRLFIPVAAR
jgi:Tn3 transposase DDE domain